MSGFGQFAESAVAETDAGEGQNGNVIVLTEGYCFGGGLLGAGVVAKKDGEPVEAVKSPEALRASRRPSV